MNKKQLLLSTLLASVTYGATVAPALAQTAADDEIVVTGSRIQRSLDFVANSPVATIGQVVFERTGSVNTEDLLNALPQTTPGLDSTSNNPGNGTATVDLRGLGANRTLVLVNGRRTQPTGSFGVVDINTIPSSLIENVEVLTGGASSVYGSDAVAGVVNFILKDDFEGIEANAGYQQTDSGDAGITDLSVTLGANSPDGKGNATVTLGYTDRDQLLQGERDFSTVSLGDDGNGGFEPSGSSGVPGTSLFGGGIGIIFEPDGSSRDFITSGDNNDFYNYAPPNFLRLPQERFNIAGSANYEINEHFEVFLEGRFSSNRVDSQLAPTPIFQNPGAGGISLDNNPFITPETQQLLSDALGDGVDTDGDGIDDTFSGLLRRRLVEVGPRFAADNRDTFQVVTGLRGDITDSVSYDVSYSEGRTNNSSFQLGNVNRDRFNQSLLLADADGDGNVDVGPDGQPTCANTDTNGSTVGCAPLNLFGAGNISQEAADFLVTAVSTTDQTIQRVLQANITGETNAIPFLPNSIAYAVGAEYIENEFVFRPSQDVAALTIAGFNGAPPVEGETDVTSAYGELSIPLVADASFAKELTLDLAGRVSDFSNGGTQYNYKVGGTWAINDIFRLRGNYNTAVRAPNIGELFAPQGENFPGGEDPCGSNAMPTAAVTALCIANGVPASEVGTDGINAVSGQVRALSGGNPDLDVEDSETITIGAVITPDIFDSFSLSVDYFDVSVDDAIATVGVGTILTGCFTGDTAGDATFCDLVNRRPDGTIDFIQQTSTNIAGFDVEGIDIAMNLTQNTDFLANGFFGDLFINYLGNYEIARESQADPTADVVDCTGRFGNFCGEPNPEYGHFMTAGLNKGMWSASLTWEYIGSVDEGADINGENDPDLQGFSVDEIGSQNYFDGSVTADLSENFQLTLGARNLFDKSPILVGDNQEQANTFPATYDVFGRTFFASAKARF